VQVLDLKSRHVSCSPLHRYSGSGAVSGLEVVKFWYR
jgi:hypothetical protein